MKQRIVGSEGRIWVLDETGFYVPEEAPPERKVSGVWAYFYVAGVVAAVLVGAYFVMEAIAGA